MGKHEWDYIEMPGLQDKLVMGLADTKYLGSGLVGVRLFGEQNVRESWRLICAKLHFPVDVGLGMNAEARAAFAAIHKQLNPFRVVSQVMLCFMAAG